MSHDPNGPTAAARAHGRPVLGGIAGLFLGVFVWIDLILFGVLPLDSGLGYLLPVLGVAAGIGMAMWAPFGGRTAVGPPSGPPGGPASGPPSWPPSGPTGGPPSGPAGGPPSGPPPMSG